VTRFFVNIADIVMDYVRRVIAYFRGNAASSKSSGKTVTADVPSWVTNLKRGWLPTDFETKSGIDRRLAELPKAQRDEAILNLLQRREDSSLKDSKKTTLWQHLLHKHAEHVQDKAALIEVFSNLWDNNCKNWRSLDAQNKLNLNKYRINFTQQTNAATYFHAIHSGEKRAFYNEIISPNSLLIPKALLETYQNINDYEARNDIKADIIVHSNINFVSQRITPKDFFTFLRKEVFKTCGLIDEKPLPPLKDLMLNGLQAWEKQIAPHQESEQKELAEAKRWFTRYLGYDWNSGNYGIVSQADHHINTIDEKLAIDPNTSKLNIGKIHKLNRYVGQSLLSRQHLFTVFDPQNNSQSEFDWSIQHYAKSQNREPIIQLDLSPSQTTPETVRKVLKDALVEHSGKPATFVVTLHKDTPNLPFLFFDLAALYNATDEGELRLNRNGNSIAVNCAEYSIFIRCIGENNEFRNKIRPTGRLEGYTSLLSRTQSVTLADNPA
jgi:hypothetical protein